MKVSNTNLALFYLLIVFLFHAFPMTAQNQVFLHYTNRDGLPSGYIRQILQDQRGFIWVCTNAGLSKFDGYNFTNYIMNPDDSSSISGQNVAVVKELDEKTFLVGTNGGFDIFNPLTEIFRSVHFDDAVPEINYVADIHIMDSGDIWITAEKGLYFLPHQDLGSDKLDVEYFPISLDSAITQTFSFSAIEFDGDHSLLIGSRMYLHKFDLNSKSFLKLGPYNADVESILGGTIWSIKRVSNEDIFITSTKGLVVWRKGSPEPEAIKELGPYTYDDLQTAGFQSITEDNQDRIWLGTGRLGAIRWDRIHDEVETFRHREEDENSINSDDAHYIFCDNQQNSWFGYHRKGISHMYSNAWEYQYQLPMKNLASDHPANSLDSFVEDQAGNIWFASLEGLIFQPFDGSEATLYPYDFKEKEKEYYYLPPIIIGNNVIVRIEEGQHSKIFKFSLITKEFEKIYEDPELGLSTLNEIEMNAELYFSSTNKKIIIIDKSTFEISQVEVPQDESYSSDFSPVLIAKYNENDLFVQQYYFVGDKATWTSFLFNPDSLSFRKLDLDVPENINVRAPPIVSEMYPGIIWARLNTGVLRYDFLNGEYEILFHSDVAVLNESISNLIEDSDGCLWMNNQTGIMRLNPLTESIANFEMRQEQKPDRLYFAGKLINGDFIFAGDGYIRYKPKGLEQRSAIQNVYISELVAGDNKYNTLNHSGTIEIESASNNLAFTYIGLNYTDPAFTRYRYRIEGYEEEWNNIGTQRRVFLANLPPGKYSFQLQAASRFGSFNENSAESEFIILPPWWRTFPAYFGYAILFLGCIYTFDRVQRRRLINKERERTREKELAQAREIEKAYHDLRATQSQLIQSEKMASLGELTAGIAHEIQNPLNFVNNFAEVNSELVEELRDEIKKGNLKEVDAIAQSIEENEQKIKHHGQRAEGIVKGMLQHSRTSKGEKEPTDINALADEYLRLAYHGMRAKDKSFNADFKTDFDPSLPKIKVVPQDIGRVLLNLINNAFYAVDKKAARHSDPEHSKGVESGTADSNVSYNSEVVVSTRKFNDKIEISVRDNGEGIPEQIRDKIFQPFFTTKPTGQGTGLGLSLSYDIVKAHGGEMKVESLEIKGSEFIIQLPLTSK